MKRTFVFDENIVVCALTHENTQRQPDRTCALLVTTVFDSIHRIAVSYAIFRRWSDKVQTVRADGLAVDDSFMQLLSQAFFDSDKYAMPETGNPSPLPGEEEWLSLNTTNTKLLDDIDFIRLAAHFECLLATADGPLKRDLVALELEARYRFLAVFPDQALQHAAEGP